MSGYACVTCQCIVAEARDCATHVHSRNSQCACATGFTPGTCRHKTCAPPEPEKPRVIIIDCDADNKKCMRVNDGTCIIRTPITLVTDTVQQGKFSVAGYYMPPFDIADYDAQVTALRASLDNKWFLISRNAPLDDGACVLVRTDTIAHVKFRTHPARTEYGLKVGERVTRKINKATYERILALQPGETLEVRQPEN